MEDDLPAEPFRYSLKAEHSLLNFEVLICLTIIAFLGSHVLKAASHVSGLGPQNQLKLDNYEDKEAKHVMTAEYDDELVRDLAPQDTSQLEIHSNLKLIG